MATQQEIANLAKLYLAARNRLYDTIVNYRGVGTKVYANSVLQGLNRELETLAKASNEFIDTAVPAEYEKGLAEVYNYFKRNHLLMKSPSLFADLHAEAINTVASEMRYQIHQGLASVGRQVLRYVDNARDEALRAVGLAASGEKIAAGATTIQMKQSMVKQLQEQGFMTVQYGSGTKAYQVPLDTYAMLCARSTTREAGNLARENQLTANGYDLMEISTHYPTCEVCAQYQGRVYSISGNDKRFPPLSTAFSNGYQNIHPNCRHVAVPWVESLQTIEEVKDAQERSNKPFEDTRGKQQVDLYNKQQAQNRQMREDLYQFERYKARLGDEAPKSYHGFRKVKKAGGEKWDDLQRNYRVKPIKDAVLKEHPDLVLGDFEVIPGVNTRQDIDEYRSILEATREQMPFADFQNLKYVSESSGYELMKGYTRAVGKGDISPLVGIDVYRDIAGQTETELVGLESKSGLEIKGYTTHFVDRVIGQYEDAVTPPRDKRKGVSIAQVKDALLNPERIGQVRTDEKGQRSIRFIGKSCMVVVNPDTKKLIQTNPRVVSK